MESYNKHSNFSTLKLFFIIGIHTHMEQNVANTTYD